MANAGAKAAREQAEQRRLAAAELFERHMPQAEIARRLGVTPQAVFKWRQRWLVEGSDGLRSKRPPGFPEWLSPQQRAELVEVLNAGPAASGFSGGWTLARVATVIRRRFGVHYRYPSAVWNLLHRLSFSAQRPARRAVERNDRAVDEWREHTWTQLVRGFTEPRRPALTSEGGLGVVGRTPG